LIIRNFFKTISNKPHLYPQLIFAAQKDFFPQDYVSVMRERKITFGEMRDYSVCTGYGTRHMEAAAGPGVAS